MIIAQETLFSFNFSTSEELYQEQIFGLAPGNKKCHIGTLNDQFCFANTLIVILSYFFITMYDRDQPSPQHPFLGIITKGTIFYHAFLSLWISSYITWSSSYRASTAILADLYKIFKKLNNSYWAFIFHLCSVLDEIGILLSQFILQSWPVWFILVFNTSLLRFLSWTLENTVNFEVSEVGVILVDERFSHWMLWPFSI